MSDQAELISIAEAAKRLGVHKNTVHAHVAAGWHRWEWMPGPKGRQKGIYVSDLHNTGPIDLASSVQSVPMDPSTRLDASAPDLPTLVNAALLPLVEQIREISTEKGRLEERVRTLEAQLSERQGASLPADMSPQPPPWWKRLLRIA